MGEYFAPVIADADWEVKGYFTPGSFGTWYDDNEDMADKHSLWSEGAKLMEHAYVGNKLPDAVCSWLIRMPARVGWFGDYTDMNSVPPRLPKDLMAVVHGDGSPFIGGQWIRKLPVPDHEASDGKWLMNLDKEQVIRIPKKQEGKWVIHPLPMLTSTDGAQYYHKEENADLIGSWAWDLLRIVDSMPEGAEKYTVLSVDFGTD